MLADELFLPSSWSVVFIVIAVIWSATIAVQDYRANHEDDIPWKFVPRRDADHNKAA